MKISTRRQIVRGKRSIVHFEESPPPSFGAVWSSAVRNNYFSGGDSPYYVQTIPGTDDVLIGAITATQPIMRLTPGGGGTPVWTGAAFAGGPFFSRDNPFSFSNDGAYAFMAADGTDNKLIKVDLSDGTHQWEAALATANSGATANNGSDQIFSFVDGAYDIAKHDGTSPTAPGQLRWTAEALTRCATITDDKVWLVNLTTAGTAGTIYFRQLSGEPADLAAWPADASFDLNSLSPNWTVTPDAFKTRIHPCPIERDAVWISAPDEDEILKINSSGLVRSFNVATETGGITATTHGVTSDVNGDCYVTLGLNAAKGVLRMTYDAVYVTDNDAQGFVLPEAANDQEDIAIGELTGVVWITCTDGDVIEYTQGS